MFLCRILAEHVSRKYLTLLVNAMARCSYFLVAESSSFSADLVHRFCASTLEQCVNAQMIQHLLAVCVTMRLISFCYSPNQCAIYTSWLTATLCFFSFLVAGCSQDLLLCGFELGRERKAFA